jgi:uncharacterized protein (DUF433 family)
MTETCATCRYWLPVGSKGFGSCRAVPPVAGAGFPRTQPDEWCGEHQPGEVKRPAIVRSPVVIDNAWRIEGTRIPVRAIKSFAEEGYPVEYILIQYPSLSREQVQAAIAFVDPEKPKAREPGWYWVIRKGTADWQIAEWQAEWWLAGCKDEFIDMDLAEIDERRITRGPAV